MRFSIFQVSGCRIQNLSIFSRKSFHTLSRCCGSNSSFKLFASETYGLEGGYSRRWIRRPISTNSKGKNKFTQGKEPSNIRHEVLDGTVLRSATLNINRTDACEPHKVQYCDIFQKIAEKEDIKNLVTKIIFDIETTGLSRDKERMIEIALQDLAGGRNSTFQTVINPGRFIPNAHIHGITTHMVNRPEVPRMEDLIPILLKYISSREKPGGYVLLVAHNARCFDVPFLVNEFARCGAEIPENWRFLDTMYLTRELVKAGGLKSTSKISLQALREHYEIPLVGSAHRAMSDVNTLSLILQRLTYDLKLPLSGLVERSFTVSDLNKKKKNSS